MMLTKEDLLVLAVNQLLMAAEESTLTKIKAWAELVDQRDTITAPAHNPTKPALRRFFHLPRLRWPHFPAQKTAHPDRGRRNLTVFGCGRAIAQAAGLGLQSLVASP